MGEAEKLREILKRAEQSLTSIASGARNYVDGPSVSALLRDMRDALEQERRMSGRDLTALIARLEAAEAGSRELDLVVVRAVGEDTRLLGWPPYTTSLDAALALAARVLPGWPCWGVATDIPGRIGAVLAKSNRDEGVTGYAPTPALALCIAILKARQND